MNRIEDIYEKLTLARFLSKTGSALRRSLTTEYCFLFQQLHPKREAGGSGEIAEFGLKAKLY
jgi:hypothetical protein